VIGFAGLILSLILMAYFHAAAAGGDGGFSWNELLVYNFLSVPFIGAIIWGLVREQTWISRLFATETFQVLGKSSYSFYLIHIGIIHSLIGKFISENVFLLFTLLILAAMALWHFIEEPMNELIRSRAKKIWVT
jgi:peptidoglycan/LPS O-acetylase OafA/YrhL